MSFEDAWSAAKQNNFDIQRTAERAKEARIQNMVTWGYMGPNIQLHGGYSFNQYEAKLDMSEAFEPLAEMLPAGTTLDFGKPIIIQPKRYFSGGVHISQPLLNAATSPALMSSARTVRSTDLSVERDLQRIKAQVAQVYYQLLASREAETLSKATADIASSQLTLAQRQVEAQLEPRRTQLLAELRLSQAQRQVLSATEQRLRAENQFFLTTGVRADGLEWNHDENALPASLEEALRLAPLKRKDSMADQLNVEIARLNKTVMTLNWLPRIDGTFDLLYTENTGFADQPVFWTAGIQASLPIWDGGERLARIRRAASRTRLAEVSKTQNRLSIQHEVEFAWAAHASAAQALDAVHYEKRLADENFTLANKSFESGGSTWLTVQEAELARSQTDLNHLQTKVAFKMAQINLLLAVGTY